MYKVNYYLKGVLSAANLTALKQTSPDAYNAQINSLKPIIISVVKDNSRFIIPTRRRIAPRFWNNEEKTIKLLKDSPANAKDIKIWLRDTKVKLEAALEKHNNSKKVDKEYLLQIVHNEAPKDTIKTWEDAIEKFLLQHKTNNGDSLKGNTKKKYKSLQRHIIDFQGHNRYDIQVIDNNWVDKFRYYLLDVKLLTDNSVCKYLRGLKTFIKATCKRRGISLDIDLADIKTVEKAPLVYILTVQELRTIKDHCFKQKELNAIRDVFLFQCFTGQRYSDIEKITWDNLQDINGSKVWIVDTVKTNDHITVPLSGEAQAIIERYKDGPYPLPRFTNQYVNRELKNIGKEAGLERKVKVIKYRNNVKVETYKHLWEVLSSHMARKTFISNSLQLGIPERAVREVSGHKDEKSFKRYIELDNSHHKLILDVWNNII